MKMLFQVLTARFHVATFEVQLKNVYQKRQETRQRGSGDKDVDQGFFKLGDSPKMGENQKKGSLARESRVKSFTRYITNIIPKICEGEPLFASASESFR